MDHITTPMPLAPGSEINIYTRRKARRCAYPPCGRYTRSDYCCGFCYSASINLASGGNPAVIEHHEEICGQHQRVFWGFAAPWTDDPRELHKPWRACESLGCVRPRRSASFSNYCCSRCADETTNEIGHKPQCNDRFVAHLESLNADEV